MDASEEELQWLAHRWPYLRDSIRVIVMQHYDPVIGEIAEQGSVEDPTWDAFVTAVLRDLDRARARRDQLFATALGLFADPLPLRRALIEAGGQLVGERAPAVRMVAVKRGLTRMRDARLGGTEHRGKTWGRLDAISRLVEKNHSSDYGPGGRCTMNHFIDLLAHLRLHHAADRSLPRKLESIEDYFQEFCADCRPVSMQGPSGLENVLESSVPAPDEGEGLLPGAALGEEALAECLETLDAEAQQFVRVQARLSDPIEFSVASFCQRAGVDRRRFYRVVERAFGALRACLEGKLPDDLAESWA